MEETRDLRNARSNARTAAGTMRWPRSGNVFRCAGARTGCGGSSCRQGRCGTKRATEPEFRFMDVCAGRAAIRGLRRKAGFFAAAAGREDKSVGPTARGRMDRGRRAGVERHPMRRRSTAHGIGCLVQREAARRREARLARTIWENRVQTGQGCFCCRSTGAFCAAA